MKYKILYTERARIDFEKLDKKLVSRILDKLDFFLETGAPLRHAKKLSNIQGNTYRFRVGDYRIIFDVDNRGNIVVLLVLRVKHRKEVYSSI